MTDINIPIRSVENPLDPRSPVEMLRFFTELRDLTASDTDLLSLVISRVELLRNESGVSSLSSGVREARLNARQSLADIKTLRFLTY